MPVLFACPHCHAETLVDDAFVGQSGPCATCGRVVRVPQAGVAASAKKAPPTAEQRSSIALLVAVVIGSLLAGVAVIGITVAIIAPAVSIARVATQKTKSAANLQLIAEALDQYHVEFGRYPPAFVADKAGKPLHSWRVLILPQLGHRDLYQRYDFSQAWDSPTNMMLVSQIPDVYIAPGDESARASFETSYLVVVGKETVFPGSGKATSRNNISDGAGSTILVVESAESGICWLEPKDLTTSGMNYNINGAPSGCIRSKHPAGASVVFADGKTHFLPNDLAPEHVEAFLTARKGDEAPLELLND